MEKQNNKTIKPEIGMKVITKNSRNEQEKIGTIVNLYPKFAIIKIDNVGYKECYYYNQLKIFKEKENNHEK